MTGSEFEYDVFISFASSDQDIVRPVWQELSAAGLRVFWSDSNLRDRVGSSWFEIIQDSLATSRHMVVIFTPAALTSSWVKREYAAFYSNFYRPPHRLMIPILARSEPADLPLFFRELEACRITDGGVGRRLVRLLGGVDIEELKGEITRLGSEVANLRLERRNLDEQLTVAQQNLKREELLHKAALEEVESLKGASVRREAEIARLISARNAQSMSEAAETARSPLASTSASTQMGDESYEQWRVVRVMTWWLTGFVLNMISLCSAALLNDPWMLNEKTMRYAVGVFSILPGLMWCVAGLRTKRSVLGLSLAVCVTLVGLIIPIILFAATTTWYLILCDGFAALFGAALSNSKPSVKKG